MEIPSTLCSNVYDFAFCPEPCYDRLADLADPEDWGHGNRILKNYLSFSFSRAVFLTERDVDQTAPSNPPLVFDDDRCLKWWFSCWFAGFFGCVCTTGTYEFKIKSKKFLVNHARLC